MWEKIQDLLQSLKTDQHKPEDVPLKIVENGHLLQCESNPKNENNEFIIYLIS